MKRYYVEINVDAIKDFLFNKVLPILFMIGIYVMFGIAIYKAW